MYEKLSEQKYLRLKLEKHLLNYQYSKLNLIYKFKLFQGEYLLKLILKKIQVAKQLFIIEIEQGNEVLIPKELSQSGLPMSYQYYDALIRVVQDGMSDELKERLRLKIQFQMEILKVQSLKQMILSKLGLKHKEKRIVEKLTFKKEQREEHEFSLAESLFTKGIQRSDYLALDHELLVNIHKDPLKMKTLN